MHVGIILTTINFHLNLAIPNVIYSPLPSAIRENYYWESLLPGTLYCRWNIDRHTILLGDKTSHKFLVLHPLLETHVSRHFYCLLCKALWYVTRPSKLNCVETALLDSDRNASLNYIYPIRLIDTIISPEIWEPISFSNGL